MSQLRDFEVLQPLGEGSFSKVYKVRRISDGGLYALKKIKLNTLKPKERENSLNEVRLLASLDNPFIIQYKEAFIEQSLLCLIMEICPEGDLLQKIKQYQTSRTFIPENEIWIAMYHITLGKQFQLALKTLHKMKILHRDIKSANIFLTKDEDGLIIHKLGDLNVSKVAKTGLVYTQTGTPYYASPEVWQDKPYNSKSDIWSLGCMQKINFSIYEMASQKPPFRANDMQGLYKKVIQGYVDPIPRSYSIDLQQLISQLLKVDPKHRPSCDEILNNKIFQSKIQSQNGYDGFDDDQSGLLATIKMPQNILNLKGKFPKAQYDKVFHQFQPSDVRSIRINSVKKPLNKIEKKNKESLQDIHQQFLKQERQLQGVSVSADYINIQKEFEKKKDEKLSLQQLRNQQYLQQQQHQNQIILRHLPQTREIQKMIRPQNIPENESQVYKNPNKLSNENNNSLLDRNNQQYRYQENDYHNNINKNQKRDYDSINSNQSQIPQNLLQKQQRFIQQHQELQRQLQNVQDSKQNINRIDEIQRQQMYVRDKIDRYVQGGVQQEKIQIQQQLTMNKNNLQSNIKLAAGQQVLANQISKPSWWG